MKKVSWLLSLWLPVVFWCGLLFYLSSIPNLKASQNPVLDEILRTLSHFVFYAFGYFLFFRALNYQKSKKNFLLPLGLVWLYGFFDELHQSFVPTRTFQLMDLAVDFGGVFIGKIIVEEFLPKLSKKILRKLKMDG